MSDESPPRAYALSSAAGEDDSTNRFSVSQNSHKSEDSQTAAEYIRHQELLEADAREALPYSIETCTKLLGPLRQNIFACLTCNPPPSFSSDSWNPAGVCYACSVQCHGEHILVEIFQKRNFTCDCGTTRIPSTSPCLLRKNGTTTMRGGVDSDEPDANNKYNQNFGNRFCGCECDYDPFKQKGTMFQCLGLGTTETGGCGEDWYHPGCLVGLGPRWSNRTHGDYTRPSALSLMANGLPAINETGGVEDIDGGHLKVTRTADPANGANNDPEDDDEESLLPPGFPDEDDFEGFLCYKCVESNPWIKRYSDTPGFLPPVFFEQQSSTKSEHVDTGFKKRKAEDDVEQQGGAKSIKTEALEAVKGNDDDAHPTQKNNSSGSSSCKLDSLRPAPTGRFSLFFREGFRSYFCQCGVCFRRMDAHPQLLEEEEVYEPPMSEDGGSQQAGSTHGSGSLLERGESALRNVDRVRAIEGVMAYNHLKEQLKPFFQQFAESGKTVSAEDVKAYFAKLRGDEQGIKEAGQQAASSHDENGGGSQRREQSGY